MKIFFNDREFHELVNRKAEKTAKDLLENEFSPYHPLLDKDTPAKNIARGLLKEKLNQVDFRKQLDEQVWSVFQDIVVEKVDKMIRNELQNMIDKTLREDLIESIVAKINKAQVKGN